ncbi:hypothetical protein [Plantactinospora sp. B24E8]|uniref:hypothetical protein n=1 Tax=Plantactinospora sp. B24E8 TaxID=3153567 RepID=UPI00325D7284
MQWTHDGTIRNALWIGGGQWAGKTTVGSMLTSRYDLVHYHCDYHDARGHEDRRVAARVRRREAAPDWAAYWTELTCQEMVERALENFTEQFSWVLDDLRALVSRRPVLADGWNLRPDLVATVADDLRRMVVLVPTDEWRRRQAETLPRAARFGMDLPDPARVRQRRLERDRVLATDAAERARALGIRVIEVDGTRDVESVTDEVARHFAAFTTG